MTTINDCSSTAGITAQPLPLVSPPVLGRLGWLCARCARSYAPDVRECLACAPPYLLQTTYWYYPPYYPPSPPHWYYPPYYPPSPPHTYYSDSTTGGFTP
jgi:hypothetical protein